MKQFKTMVTVLMMVLLAAVAAGGCEASGGAAISKAEVPPVRVEVYTMGTATHDINRSYSGYLSPWNSHGLGFMVAGRVTKLKVREGDRVKKGQLVATISAEDYALVKQMADIQADTIEPNLQRVNALVDKQVLPKSQLDELDGRYRAAVTQQKQAKRQLGYTKLFSPLSGTVMETRTSVGQVIGAGQPAVVILDLDRMKFKMGVPQRDINYFKKGDSIAIDIPGVDGSREATVYAIDYVGDAATRTYNVMMQVPNEDGALRAAMYGSVTLKAESHSGMFIPLYALLHTPIDRKPFVMVASTDGSTAQMRMVTPGIMVGDWMKIEEGLAEGDRVIVKGHEFLTNGDRILVP